jgi:7-cyano-7-deazaguanine reductase
MRMTGEPSGRGSPTVPGVAAETRSDQFVALGHTGSEHYAGLETFRNPGVAEVVMTSDELTAVCPVTGQPDLYTATIEYRPRTLCVESKSLKLYLGRFRNERAFCEALAVQIRNDVAAALELDAQDVRVTLRQKARGGITITATA